MSVQTLAAGALLSTFLVASFAASQGKSATGDEPSHLASGLSYVSTGEFVANLQHPPLLKELSGVSMLIGGIRWPTNPQTAALIDNHEAGLEWRIGTSLLMDDGAQHVMAWARLPFPLLATLLGLVIYLWGRQVVGEPAALCALFLFVADPTIMAHSYLVTTDVGFAAFEMLFLCLLWNYLARPDRKRAVWSGLAMGAMLGAKFSAVALIPVAALLLLAAAVWPLEPQEPAGHSNAPSQASGRRGRRAGKRHHVEPPNAAQRALVWQRALRYSGGLAVMLLVAAGVIEALYLFSGELYFTGLGLVNADHDTGYLAFMAGDLAPRFRTYFAVAYLLKEPLAAIALAIGGLAVVGWTKVLTPLHRLFLIVPPAVLFVGYSLGADNLGVRYLIPMLPFAFLLGGAALAALLRGRAIWMRGVAVTLGAWLLLTAIGIWPDHMSYFNELACAGSPAKIGLDGGARCGTLWLDDSNVDWGQGLVQLRTWLERHATGREIRLASFGLVPPEAYGIEFESVDPQKIVSDPAPGLYVLTAHLVARLPAFGDRDHNGAWAWLRETPPTAVIGHAMYVYDIPGSATKGGKSPLARQMKPEQWRREVEHSDPSGAPRASIR